MQSTCILALALIVGPRAPGSTDDPTCCRGMVHLGRLTQQRRLAHHFTSKTSIHKPLGMWPDTPAASVVLSPINQILSSQISPGAGQGRSWDCTSLALIFYSNSVLPGTGSLPSMVSSQLSHSQSHPCPSVCWFQMERNFARGASVWKVKGQAPPSRAVSFVAA